MTSSISGRLTSPVVAIRVAAFSRIHRHRSWKVDTVSTVLVKAVFITPISKKILEITGMEVMATPMTNTSRKEISFPRTPMNASWNSPAKGAAASMGSTVAPVNTQPMIFMFFRSTSMRVLKPEENIRNTSPSW